MVGTVEDEMEIEPFLAAGKDIDYCHLFRDKGSEPITHLPAGCGAAKSRSYYPSPKDLITFASN